MISIPVAAHVDLFKWQLDLFWHCHQRLYGKEARDRMRAIIMKRNDFWSPKNEWLKWSMNVPHTMCEAFFDQPSPVAGWSLMALPMVYALPLNIQIGLAQILDQFDDDDVLEITDCDMFHFRPAPNLTVNANELIVSTVYEDWHLRSLTTNRHVIQPYFENDGQYYNGGFVPIIGRASTFKRILYEWTAVHTHILMQPHDKNIHWWAGMFALQAACEKARVQMIGMDLCYVPGANSLTDTQYIGHYAIDFTFNKRTFPQIDTAKFDLADPYYAMIKEWIERPVDAPQRSVERLDELGVRFNIDKSSKHHNFLVFYERYVGRFREKKDLKLLEIGVFQGNSLRVWECYFPNGHIVGIDIDPKALDCRTDRIAVELVDQSNVVELVDLATRHGPFEIVIDDGSHQWNHQITTFNTLFPFVKPGGLYILEDLDTSYGTYQETFRGIADESAAKYLQRLSDYVVGDSALDRSLEPNAYFRSFAPLILSITFHARTCIIERR